MTYVAQWKQGQVVGSVKFDRNDNASGLMGLKDMTGEVASTDESAETTALSCAMQQIASQNTGEDDADKKVTVELNISTSCSDPDAMDAIKAKVANDATSQTGRMDIMDISITKQVAEIIENDDGTTREEEVGEPETITEINRVIEIPLMYDMTGYCNLRLFRCHNGVAAELTRLYSRPKGYQNLDGRYYTSGSGQNTVYLYAVSPDGSCAPRLSKTTAKLQITKRANPVAVSAPEASSAPAAPAAEPILTIPGVKKSNKARVEVGKVYQIDLGGNVAKNYKSSRKKIATVDRNGLVVPKAKGKVKITFKVGKKKRTINLTVTDPTVPTVVTITASGPLTGKKGETVQLTATLPSGTKSAIKWQSSNKKVATVSSTGLVTFKKPGKATITATAVRGKKKAKVKVNVSK